MGIGMGGMFLLGAIHALVSKPVLTLNDAGVQVNGWLIPQSNVDLKWGDVSSARVTTDAAQIKVLWLTDKAGKVKGIEATRFEAFQEIMDFSQKKLTEKGIELEFVSLPAPK
jgi:hypothetical protein